MPPCNTGVVIVNHGRAADLARLDGWFIRCVWHLVVWMSAHPSMLEGAATAPSRESTRIHLASAEQRARALPYPSANQCIVEEVATWLALGALPGLTTGRLSPAHVPQNGELADAGDLPATDWLLCHYFSTDPHTALTWLDAGQPAVLTRS